MDDELAGRAAPGRLRASWLRSERYGVSPDHVDPVFSGTIDTGSLLYSCASEVLSGLQATIANEPVALMIADRDGMVLARLCPDTTIQRSLDRVHLAPGFSYSERVTGTNGLGLSLADRAPTLVKAEEHYCTGLRGYTCAAVPVLDPVHRELVGSVNLTTWSGSSSALLLALAQAAASATSALMLARGAGRTLPPAPRGEVFTVIGGSLASADGDPCVSAAWHAALDGAATAVQRGRGLAVLGAPGSGRSTLAALARRRAPDRPHLLHVRAPDAGAVAGWLALWTPELAKPGTCVIISGADTLPAWAAGDLAHLLAAASPDRWVLTAPDLAALPAELSALTAAAVTVPGLAQRPDDVLPLAHHFAARVRHRPAVFTPRAVAALTAYHWPGNTRQLRRIVRDAANRATTIDLQHLSTELLDGPARQLTRLETLERDEIARCLTEPGQTMTRAAEELGISRATLYRKTAYYRITVPR
ncbi:helix-turn-helix domain-containing protein [Actinoplanes couchii]|uniref:Sigma-54 factor interaction domain-containing protein n=1 Tax=Actinoplanes couchii TaxID=403638 RepID=A0ABQ3X8B3_9ACTN|nr:helix-turn-helix domain-containing protein [Actinoplanes couchii]MDR6320229.1 transcriptional regulator of acetoin/glycerol metabolism [Actinoplanes couchii]GID54756.1 hypothetical protein Aco03nite_031600 [Actinoplanes couchii]